MLLHQCEVRSYADYAAGNHRWHPHRLHIVLRAGLCAATGICSGLGLRIHRCMIRQRSSLVRHSQELFCLWKMPFDVHSFVQDADNQDVALRMDRMEDYEMPTMESIQIRHNFIILF